MTRTAIEPSERVGLRNGATVTLRPMCAEDADALVRFHATLSRETTYLRFFSVHPWLSPEEVERFTNVDHAAREAVVAEAGPDIVGVGRFDRVPESSTAEVAFVVSDDWQGLGIGTALFARLAARAREVGVESLIASTLLGNVRMLHVFRRSGLPVRVTYDDVAHVEIEL